MLKRWAALPRDTRWLVGIAAVVLALAVVWALFVPVADWLAHHDVGSVGGSLHETAVDNARGRLLTLGAGLFAAGALVFTARNFTLSREGQVTDRYTKAIEQLGSDKLDVRIGGIYALERVARDSRRDHPTVMEVLAAFIRMHSHEQWPEAGAPIDVQQPEAARPPRATRPDVQAAVTVIGRRISRNDRKRIDLGDADLTGAWLGGADLTGAFLTGAILTGALLGDADLTGAWLGGAILGGADLTGAILTGAILTRANLGSANLTRAILADANLTRAYLSGADLSRADLSRANLTRADLTDAHLTDAHLTDAHLTGAEWPADAPVPEGWELDTGSGRLKRAGPGSKPAGAN